MPFSWAISHAQNHQSSKFKRSPLGLLLLSTTLFCPLGGDRYVDTAMVAQSLARLRETEPEDFFSRFNSLGGTKSAEAEPPSEIIMICLDTSKSMEEDADFPDMNKSNVSADNHESEEDCEEPMLPESGIEWSSEEVQGILTFSFLIQNIFQNAITFGTSSGLSILRDLFVIDD